MHWLWFFILTVGIYVVLIFFTRFGGFRSFSKMSSFDFAITVVIGSIIATSLLSSDPPLLQSVVALGILGAVQMTVAGLRGNSMKTAKMVDNKPILLMNGTHILDKNMGKAGVIHSDLRAKLWKANVTKLFPPKL